MAHRKERAPKRGDRVAAPGHNGTFVVSAVDGTLRTAELKMIGHDFALSLVPWRALTFVDELDTSQNALRIVRESTGSK